MSTKKAAENSSSLLGLPAELRNRIYDYLFVETPNIHIKVVRQTLFSNDKQGQWLGLGMGLPYSCHQLYFETITLAYSAVHVGFFLHRTDSHRYTEQYILDQIPAFKRTFSKHLSSISHLDIGVFDVAAVMPIRYDAVAEVNSDAAARFPAKWTSERKEDCESMRQSLKQLASRLPNIECITIHGNFYYLFGGLQLLRFMEDHFPQSVELRVLKACDNGGRTTYKLKSIMREKEGWFCDDAVLHV